MLVIKFVGKNEHLLKETQRLAQTGKDIGYFVKHPVIKLVRR